MPKIVSPGRYELRESRADVLAPPILIAVCVLAVVVRVLFNDRPSATVLGVCLGIGVLDGLLAWYLLRTGKATLVVTPGTITYTPRQGRASSHGAPQIIQRTAESRLSFYTTQDGDAAVPTGFLHLRDDATGSQISVQLFNRWAVRRACETQGWPFS
jgi:hypothetical protein